VKIKALFKLPPFLTTSRRSIKEEEVTYVRLVPHSSQQDNVVQISLFRSQNLGTEFVQGDQMGQSFAYICIGRLNSLDSF
jgi:hypothetical protein